MMRLRAVPNWTCCSLSCYWVMRFVKRLNVRVVRNTEIEDLCPCRRRHNTVIEYSSLRKLEVRGAQRWPRRRLKLGIGNAINARHPRILDVVRQVLRDHRIHVPHVDLHSHPLQSQWAGLHVVERTRHDHGRDARALSDVALGKLCVKESERPVAAQEIALHA